MLLPEQGLLMAFDLFQISVLGTRCNLVTNECKTFTGYSIDLCLVTRMPQAYEPFFKNIVPRIGCPMRAVGFATVFFPGNRRG